MPGGGLAAGSTADNHTGAATIYNTGGSNQQSYVLARTIHDRASRAVEVLSDNTGDSSHVYDGADRRIQTTDAADNVIDYEYDNNSNLTLVTATEKCTITGPQTIDDESFASATFHDCLNRPVLTAVQGADGSFDPDLDESTDGVPWVTGRETIISLAGYDSRSNQTLSVDPKGNTTITVFDGASRATMVQEHLRQDGQGQNPPAEGTSMLPYGGATIRGVTTDYDGNGRVTRLTDDDGNATAYAYDTLDREVTMTFPDASTRQYVYNKASNVTTFTDENGSVFANTFDALGRKTQSDITQAAGVIGTTQQKFEYDGLSRMTFSRDTISASSADVSLYYDSLSRVIEDSQVNGGNTRNATNTAFTSHPVTEMTYPNGRTIDNTYDLLYRRTDVSDSGSSIAAWEFFGPARVAEVELGNGLIGGHMNNARTHSAVQPSVPNPAWGNQGSDRLGYDGAGRMITKRHLAGGVNGTTGAYDDPTAVVGQTTAYDKASNKFYERSLQAESRSSLYEPIDTDGNAQGGYDSIDRLRQYQRGVLSDGSGGGDPAPAGGSVVTPISLPGTDESRDYDLDGLGNWKKTTFDPVGGSATTQKRDHNGLNQITRLIENSTKTPLSYDLNGNLLDDGTRKYEWDALNRLKQVSKTPSTPVTIGEYTYDALGRRVQKVVTGGGLSGSIPNGTTDFLYHSGISQCCEERDNTNSVTKQYVWGIYIDELLQMKTAVTINGNAAGDYYPLSDTLYRTVALSNSSGAIVEAYDTDAYGNTLIFTAAGTAANWWADDAVTGDNPTCNFIFTGRRYDAEAEIYFYLARFYSPALGRFLGRDSYGFLDGLNPFVYVGGMPVTLMDPSGMLSFESRVDAYTDFQKQVSGKDVKTFIGTAKWQWEFTCIKTSGRLGDSKAEDVEMAVQPRGPVTASVTQPDKYSWSAPVYAQTETSMAASGSYGVQSSRGGPCMLVFTSANVTQYAVAGGGAKGAGASARAKIAEISYSVTYEVCCYCLSIERVPYERGGRKGVRIVPEYDYSIRIVELKQSTPTKEWKSGVLRWGRGIGANYAILKTPTGNRTKVDLSAEIADEFKGKWPTPAAIGGVRGG